MKLTINKKIGNNRYAFSFDGNDLFEVLTESQKVSIYDLDKCGLCGSELLRLHAYETKTGNYQYIKVSCNKCRGSITLGKAKRDGAHYYRRNEDGSLAWEKFEGQAKSVSPSSSGNEVDLDLGL